MYQPAAHRENRLEVQQAFIHAHPLGILVTVGAGGLTANALPFLLDSARGANGTLLAHCARANPQWHDHDPSVGPLVIFQGPQAYITPSWYPEKSLHGKVVPTWNYISVHVYGALTVRDDPAWLRWQIGALTEKMEKRRAAPWSIDDAPRSFIDALIQNIVGLEIEILRIEGKWKLSQNRSKADQAGVAAGLRAEDKGEEHSLMADMVAEQISGE
jgi:transcriptional regulator